MNEIKQLEEMCAAVPPPDPQLLARTRARVFTEVAERRAVPPRPERRRPRWVAPVGAAAAVAAVAVTVATVPGAIRGSGSAGGTAASAGGTGTDANARTAYAEILDGRTGLVPINTATNQPGKPIHIHGLSAAAVTPDGKTVYACAGDTVIPISTATNKAGRPIRFDGAVTDISMDPDGQTAYAQVKPRGSAAVLVPFRTATNSPGTPVNVRIPGGDSADIVAFTPDGKTAYVAGSGTVTPISTATNTSGRPINTGMQMPVQIVVAPDGQSVYVVGYPGDRSTILPISTASNTPRTPIRLPDGDGNLMAIAPDGKTAYVIGSGSRLNNAIVPINLTTNALGKAIPIRISSSDVLNDIVFTPDGKTAYVSGTTGGVVPVSTATGTAGTPINVGPGPKSIAVTPDGQTLYAFNGQQVVPVSTATNMAGTPIPIHGPVTAWDLLISGGPAH